MYETVQHGSILHDNLLVNVQDSAITSTAVQ